MGRVLRIRSKRKSFSAKQWLVGLLLVVLFLPVASDAANGFFKKHTDCRIVGIIDGDTVRAICPKSGYVSARIMGYDTPEFNARCAGEAIKAFAATQVLRWELYTAKHIQTWPRGTDRYGRQLVVVVVDGQGVASRMISSGLARTYDGEPRRGWCGKGVQNV